MILILILAPQPLAPGSTCPHLPSHSYDTVGRLCTALKQLKRAQGRFNRIRVLILLEIGIGRLCIGLKQLNSAQVDSIASECL